MSLRGQITRAHDASFQASREILIWTTRDGREIPLEDMSSEHVANAIRVLSLWRSRLKRRGGDTGVIRDLTDAITRFKTLQRRRRRSDPQANDARLALPKPVRTGAKPTRAKPEGSATQSSSFSKPAAAPRSRWVRPRKPVAKT